MTPTALLAGLALLLLTWSGPLLSVWRESFAAHMLAHMGVVAIAAPLIALGLAGRLRALPVSAPVVASLVEFIVVWGWHAPSARLWAETSHAATAFEHLSFLAAGLYLWLSCLGAGEPGGRAAGAVGMLLTSVHMTLLGALLALSSRPLYGLGDVTCFGIVLSAAQDQQIGAVAMLLIGSAVYLAGGVFLLAGLLRKPIKRAA